MTPEQLIATIVAVLGTNSFTAWVTAKQARKRTDAEADQIHVQTADGLVTTLNNQLQQALARIASLEVAMHAAEKKERVLSDRIWQLETALVRNGIEVPLPRA